MKNAPVRQLALGSIMCLAAFGASAQSSVKVYGLLDLGLGYSKAAGSTVSQTSVDSGKMTTSYYGIGGTEDLGGGLSAQFKLEGFLRADTGEQGRNSTDMQFARAANVGLSHKDYGTLTVGRAATALYATLLKFNAFGDSFGYSPTIRHYFGSGQAAVTGDNGWSDSINYSSPSFSGFTFGGAWASKEDSSGGLSNGGNWSVNASYSDGPWAAALVVHDVKKDGTAAVNDTHTTHVSGSYDFGVAKVFLQYGEVENNTTLNDRKLTDLSVRVPYGKGAFIAAWGKNNPDTGATRTTTSAGYVYPLSKLTDLYAVGMRDKLDGSSSGYSYSAGMRLRF